MLRELADAVCLQKREAVLPAHSPGAAAPAAIRKLTALQAQHGRGGEGASWGCVWDE